LVLVAAAFMTVFIEYPFLNLKKLVFDGTSDEKIVKKNENVEMK
jgi:hypothetical protein